MTKIGMLVVVFSIALFGCGPLNDMNSKMDQMNQSMQGMNTEIKKTSAAAQDMDQELQAETQYTKQLVEIMQKLVSSIGGGGAPVADLSNQTIPQLTDTSNALKAANETKQTLTAMNAPHTADLGIQIQSPSPDLSTEKQNLINEIASELELLKK